ncbi:MAG: alpha/beta fold hydrolase, partial [Methylobacteriaceae bacterium]|nr:alpha/beta fold hydrolase [Methylobacteriaceae bacterium]
MILRFEDCAIDIDRRELRRNGEIVHIEPQVFDLLVYLAKRGDRVVDKDELFSSVWSGRFVSDAALGSRINAARVAIGDSGREQRLLRTIPKRGFRFIGEIATEPQTDAEAQALDASQTVKFCRSADGVALAVATSGEGDVLIKTANWLTHVEHDWSSPVWGPTFRRWSAGRRFVRYDARGTGLSDRDPPDFSFAGFERDFEAVVESVGAKRFAILGMSQGASVAIAYAARHPER